LRPPGFHSSGIARTNSLPQVGAFDFPYSSSFAFEAFDNVTVPAGNFDVVRVSGTVTIDTVIGTGTESRTHYAAEGLGVVNLISTPWWSGKTATSELVSTNAGYVTLLAPNGEEPLPSGETYDILWEASADADYFQLKYSVDNGITWLPIVDAEHVTDTHHLWTVPSPPANKKACRVMVTGYNAANVKVKTDTSDAPFTIEVASLTAPMKDEIVPKGTVAYPVTWITNGISEDVSSTTVFYALGNSGKWKKAAGTVVDPLISFNWDVPSSAKPKKAKLKVVFKDASGDKVATAISSVFSIE
jgi:hypothetical protein